MLEPLSSAAKESRSTKNSPQSTTTRPGRNFLVLWTGQAVNQLGTQVTVVAMPLLAVQSLHAGPSQIGLLQASAGAAFVLMGLPAGPLVDRMAKRRILLTVNLLSAVLVGAVVLAHHLEVLELPHLYVAALALGICGVVAGVAFLSIVPEVVPPDRMITATGRLTVVQTIAQVVGPAAGGLLIGTVGAANALVTDALSFLVAACSIALLRDTTATVESAAPPRERLGRLVADGLRFVSGTTMLRRITTIASAATFFGAVWQTALIVFLVQTLGAGSTTVGAVIGLSAIGGVLGGLLAPRLFRRYGRAVFVRWAMPAGSAPGLLMVLAQPGWWILLVALADFCMMFGSIVFNVAQTSARLTVCPRPMLGRMNATIRTTVWTSSTVGSLVGAALGSAFSPRGIILVGILGTLVATAAAGWGRLEVPPDRAAEHND